MFSVGSRGEITLQDLDLHHTGAVMYEIKSYFRFLEGKIALKTQSSAAELAIFQRRVVTYQNEMFTSCSKRNEVTEAHTLFHFIPWVKLEARKLFRAEQQWFSDCRWTQRQAIRYVCMLLFKCCFITLFKRKSTTYPNLDITDVCGRHRHQVTFLFKESIKFRWSNRSKR